MKNINDKLIEDIIFLYKRDWDEEISEDDQYNLESYAEKVVEKYGWDNVYNAAYKYLCTNCISPESVINFAHLFWIYGWQEYSILKLYEFLAYFYFRIDMNTKKYDEMNILDSLTTSILPKSGYKEANLYNNPSYLPEQDPMILSNVKVYKDGKEKN